MKRPREDARSGPASQAEQREKVAKFERSQLRQSRRPVSQATRKFRSARTQQYMVLSSRLPGQAQPGRRPPALRRHRSDAARDRISPTRMVPATGSPCRRFPRRPHVWIFLTCHAAGRRTSKRAPMIAPRSSPSSYRFVAMMFPPWASMIWREMLSPSPEWVPNASATGRWV